MGDGLLGKCAACTRKDTTARYASKSDTIAVYAKEYRLRPAAKARDIERHRAYRILFPGKYAARFAVSNAIRDGRLAKAPCERCGSLKVEAHHPDYRKKLDVQWLCMRHHREVEGKAIK